MSDVECTCGMHIQLLRATINSLETSHKCQIGRNLPDRQTIGMPARSE